MPPFFVFFSDVFRKKYFMLLFDFLFFLLFFIGFMIHNKNYLNQFLCLSGLLTCFSLFFPIVFTQFL